MDDFRLIQTLQNIEHVGSSPSVTMRLLERMEEPDSSLEDAAFLISQDPTISAQILRIANSAYYSRGNRIGTISQAVIHLGLETIKRIAFAVELIGLYQNREAHSDFDDVCFWKHTLAGALLCHEIALLNGLGRSESSFLTGLLRNLGVLVIRQYFPDLFAAVLLAMRSRQQSFAEAARRTCGIDHREITHLLGIRWKLPEDIVSAVRGLQGPTRNEAVQHMIHQVGIADTILHQKEFGVWDPHFGEAVSHNLINEYRLTDARIDELCSRTIPQVNELAKQLFSW